MLQLQTPGNVPIMCKSLRLLRKGKRKKAGLKSFRKLHKEHSKLNGILQCVTFDRFIYLFNSKILMKVEALEQQILSYIRTSGPQHSRLVPLTFEVYMQAPAGTG